jgi:outer membrane immunogenic protein
MLNSRAPHAQQLQKDIWMKKTLSTLALCAALASGAAQASDLPSRKGAPAYETPISTFSWTGLYAGVNVGGGWAANAWNGSSGYVLGGAQIGYNYQISPLFVAGLEADFQGASSHNLNWFGTARARLGITPFSPNLMFYGTGGFAYGEARNGWNNGNGWNTVNNLNTGWTGGGGVEWAFLPNWSAKAEYLYTDLSGSNNGGWGGWVSNHSKTNTVRLGLNYHFNGGAPAPIFAKY